jgi:hypothetical protein
LALEPNCRVATAGYDKHDLFDESADALALRSNDPELNEEL